MKAFVWITAATMAMAALGCRKGQSDSASTNSNNALQDSVAAITRDIYLWYQSIPASFNARSYADPNKTMEAVRAYSIEPGYSQPVDRWSFAVLKKDWDKQSQGISSDFGMNVFFFNSTDLRVSAVERASPAGRAGIQRSWRVKQINGNANMSTSNADFIVNAVYYSNSSTFIFTRPSGTDTTITLTASSYQQHPLLLDTVYNAGAKNVGYMVFNSFLGDTTEIKNEFQRVFNRFTSQGVQDVIVDLRYNGGGYVSMENALGNYLVPVAGNGGLAITEKFNDKYTNFNTSTYFRKTGSLDLGRLFVIVSKQTASASELLINSLKPYMDVQLVGPTPTHGKPVGFFPIPVQDWYIFPVSFRTVNKNGDGNYFNGLSLNYKVIDGLDKFWGDRSENCLASTLNYITNGVYARIAQLPETATGRVLQNTNETLGASSFKGAVEKRHSLR